MSNASIFPFQRKFFVIWLITGLVLGLILTAIITISTMTDSTSNMPAKDLWTGILLFPLLSTVVWCIFGGLGLVLDAGRNYNWKFKEITHPQWKWYCYPVFGYIGTLIFLFTFIWGFMKAFSGKK